MAAHPVPADRMLPGELVELAPQLRVLYRLAVARAPAVSLPRLDPLLDAVLHVLRIEIQIDVGAALQRLERANDRGEFHPVVRGLALATEEFALAPIANQQRAPTARTGIAFARPVGIDDDRAHRSSGAVVCVVNP